MKPAYWYRGLFYVVGMLCLALGLTLNTKTGLGVSPILSVAYALSQMFHWNLGNTAFGMYVLFVAGQLALLPRSSWRMTLLQLPTSLVFSQVLNLIDWSIAWQPEHHTLLENGLLLCGAMVFTGIGAAMVVNMELAANPGDGIVAAIGYAMGKELGTAKNLCDIFCVAFTSLLGVAITGEVIGIGVGTLCAMILVGRVIHLFNGLCRRPMRALAGLAPVGEKEEAA